MSDDEHVLISRGTPFGVTSTNNNLLNLEQHRPLLIAVAEADMSVTLHVGLLPDVAVLRYATARDAEIDVAVAVYALGADVALVDV